MEKIKKIDYNIIENNTCLKNKLNSEEKKINNINKTPKNNIKLKIIENNSNIYANNMVNY